MIGFGAASLGQNPEETHSWQHQKDGKRNPETHLAQLAGLSWRSSGLVSPSLVVGVFSGLASWKLDSDRDQDGVRRNTPYQLSLWYEQDSTSCVQQPVTSESLKFKGAQLELRT